jgi:hypothetical protein
MQERTVEMFDGADVGRHSPVDAAVQRIADNRMADCAEVHSDLMGAAGVNRHPYERQEAKPFGANNSRHRFTTPPSPRGLGGALATLIVARRHLLAIRGIAADWRIYATARLNLSPDERHILLFNLAVVKLT